MDFFAAQEHERAHDRLVEERARREKLRLRKKAKRDYARAPSSSSGGGGGGMPGGMPDMSGKPWAPPRPAHRLIQRPAIA